MLRPKSWRQTLKVLSSLFGRVGPIKTVVFLIALIGGISAFLMAGSVPSNEMVESDIKREVEKSTDGKAILSIQSVKTLDGWSDGAELEVTYALNATADFTIQSGILAGLVLKSGKELRDGKISASYQWNRDTKSWEPISVGSISLPQ